MAQLLSIKAKSFRLNQILSLLKRSSSLVKNAEQAYDSGLANGQNLLTLAVDVQERLTVAETFRDAAHEQLDDAWTDAAFPYYIDPALLPTVNGTRPLLDFVDNAASPDEIVITDHPDALEIFNGSALNYFRIEGTGDANEGLVMRVEGAASHTSTAGDSRLEVKTATVTASTNNAGRLTLVKA